VQRQNSRTSEFRKAVVQRRDTSIPEARNNAPYLKSRKSAVHWQFLLIFAFEAAVFVEVGFLLLISAKQDSAREPSASHCVVFRCELITESGEDERNNNTEYSIGKLK
jgi:hypothetical protein